MADQEAGGVEDGRSGLKILLVSKDVLFARIAKTKLEAWGHSACIEEDAAAALHWFKLDPIRLVIIDFDLPDGGGGRLCRELRAAPRAGYVYLLGYGSGADKENTLASLEAGVDSYAHKPLHPGELRLRLQHANRLLLLDDALFQGAGTDPVTGLLSRQSFERFFAVVYEQCRRSGSCGALIFIELTEIRELSGRLGLQAVQAIEQELARQINTLYRSSDFLGRIDEGSFCLLLGTTTPQSRQAVTHRLAEALLDFSHEIDGETVRPRLAIAAVDFPLPTMPWQDILHRAPRITMAVLGGQEETNAQPVTAI